MAKSSLSMALKPDFAHFSNNLIFKSSLHQRGARNGDINMGLSPVIAKHPCIGGDRHKAGATRSLATKTLPPFFITPIIVKLYTCLS